MNEFNRLRRNILLNSGGLPAGYEWATDKDFSGTTNGTFKYIGTKQYVAIPHTIKGVNVTSYASMFYDVSLIKGVYSDNMNITSMKSMFWRCYTTSLDLSSFNTSKVTNMSLMFNGCRATSLDLRSFNTSKVTNMSNMFQNSLATLLDLRSFDTSRVTNTDYMFHNTSVTRGYARTQADADKFNASLGNPGLRFTVRP